jgi:hypothetical protein
VAYQAHLLQHLEKYKQSELEIDEPGLFRYRGRDLPKAHILPVAKAWHNLPEPARSLARAYLGAHPDVKLHKYFHHLNSSQAFAFSLFFPFFDGGPSASTALLRTFGLSGTLAAWEPEAIPDPDEGTNLDARWSLTDGTTIFCEVKLSEGDFGKAKNDDRHVKKLREIYLPRLHGHIEPRLLTAPKFFAAYQIFRNVWHLVSVPNSKLVFLLPKANARLWKLLLPTLDSIASATRDRIFPVAIEDVLRRLQADQNCPGDLREYAKKLERKYVPTAS